MNRIKSLFGTAISAMIGSAAILMTDGRHHMGRTRYGVGGRGPRSRYMPHQGPREIARRQRQAAR